MPLVSNAWDQAFRGVFCVTNLKIGVFAQDRWILADREGKYETKISEFWTDMQKA